MDFWTDEERKPHQLKEKKFVRGRMRNERNNTEGPFSKVTSIIAEYKGRVGLARFWRPGDPTIANNPQASQEKSTSILKTGNSPSPPMYQRLCPWTANNQLKLADFPTFVREPAALAQLSICRKESREPGRKKDTFKSLFFISLFSAPPLPGSTAVPLSSLCSLFKNSFYNNLFLYVARAPGILTVTCLQRDTPPS